MKTERAKEIVKQVLTYIFEDLEIYDTFYRMDKEICKEWCKVTFGVTAKEFDEIFGKEEETKNEKC